MYRYLQSFGKTAFHKRIKREIVIRERKFRTVQKTPLLKRTLQSFIPYTFRRRKTFYWTIDPFKEREWFIYIIVILILTFILQKPNSIINTFLPKPTTTPTPATLTLPNNWVKSTQPDDNKIIIRLERKSNNNSQPVIILTKSQYQTDVTDKYVDQLINGAKSSFPGLRYNQDKIIKKSPYIRNLNGYYYSAGQKININQQIHVIPKTGTVYVLTASYADNIKPSIDNEIKTYSLAFLAAKNLPYSEHRCDAQSSLKIAQ